MKHNRIARWVLNVSLVFVAMLWLGPYLWMVIGSFKTLQDLLLAPLSPIPSSFRFEAYAEVFQAIPVGRYLLNTVAMSLLIAALQIALVLPAGYALAKLRFVGKRTAFLCVIACLLIPAQVTFVPVFTMLAHVNLVNTMTGLVLPFGASALGTFMVRQALMSIPDELIEAARMDGASELTIIYRLLAPMLTPTLVSLFLLSFVFHWNDYFWPLVMTTDERVRTMPLAVALLREQGTGVRWPIVMAGNVILSAPALLVFAFAQKHLLRAVAARR
jgi:sn-glycerol 3-phosphate transport system permease protein